MRMFSLRSAFTVGRNPTSCDLLTDNEMFDEEEENLRLNLPEARQYREGGGGGVRRAD